MNYRTSFMHILNNTCPAAYANICGNENNPDLNGTVCFYDVPCSGTLVKAEIRNLPDMSNEYPSAFYGMHIHDNGDCSLPFDKTGNHYNPCDFPHPMHAGDMPPLLGSHGYAYSVFYTGRFMIKDIVGRSVIIHGSPDDFTTQPSGNSGEKIGCGTIYSC